MPQVHIFKFLSILKIYVDQKDAFRVNLTWGWSYNNKATNKELFFFCTKYQIFDSFRLLNGSLLPFFCRTQQ